MKFSYTSYFPALPQLKHNKRPELPIEVFFGERKIKITPVIDTGADYSLFNIEYAKDLVIDLNNALKLPVMGIGGMANESFLVPEIEIQIIGIDKKVKIPAAFIDSKSVDALLGQLGFFDYFKVVFEKYNNTFEVKPV